MKTVSGVTIRNNTFYMFYTDKSNGQSKGEILSNQNHTSKGPTS